MIDPILILKDYMMKGKKVKQENTELIFGSVRIPLSAPTAWRKGEQEHYTIGALWVYLTNSKAELKTYINEVKRFMVAMVSITDKDAIKDYFFGKNDNGECIEEEFRTSTLITKHKKLDALTETPGQGKHDEEAMELGSARKDEGKAVKLTKREKKVG